MKLVDVLGAKQFSDGERIITQVRDCNITAFYLYVKHMTTCLFIHDCVYSLQGDKADCFYIVESGEVKIMMKSKVRCLF